MYLYESRDIENKSIQKSIHALEYTKAKEQRFYNSFQNLTEAYNMEQKLSNQCMFKIDPILERNSCLMSITLHLDTEDPDAGKYQSTN